MQLNLRAHLLNEFFFNTVVDVIKRRRPALQRERERERERERVRERQTEREKRRDRGRTGRRAGRARGGGRGAGRVEAGLGGLGRSVREARRLLQAAAAQGNDDARCGVARGHRGPR